MAKKILLVDDEVDITELLSTLLMFHSYDVESVYHGDDALGKLGEDSFDLICTDLMMPEISGFELVQKIRAMEGYQDIPIISLSAKILKDDERKLLFQNNVTFVTKPFEPEDLVNQIVELLS